ncbi:MAG: 7-carboxy-7-deazaguanine synthase QueE [Planctomycetota bacterium]|nr:7-carboxy-7-deazaguanine synthase QueE [Planctomycetota bacterium]
MSARLTQVRTGTSAGSPALPAKSAAPVMEVFASIQGEGAYVGEPQVFVRLQGCPLRCRWCDTPASWELDAELFEKRMQPPPAPPIPRVGGRVSIVGGGVSIAGGSRGWRVGALASVADVAAWVPLFEGATPRTVSVTGGEPLVWPDFVAALRDALAPRRIHLETAGAHPEALARVVARVDHVSLDLKLPADLDEPVWPESDEPLPRTSTDWASLRARTLPLVRGRDACGKLIVAGGRRPEEYGEYGGYAPILDDVSRLAPELPLYVQPVTPMNGVPAPTNDEVDMVVEAALSRGLTVRVVPQVHRSMRRR